MTYLVLTESLYPNFFETRNGPRNTPRVFHVEMTWERPFLRRFNVEFMWCVCREAGVINEKSSN